MTDTDTDLDRAVHVHLERLVADAPLPPTVDEIVGGRDETARRRRRPVVLAGAAAFVLLAAVGGVLLARQSDPPAGPTAAPRGSVRADPDLVVVFNPGVTEPQVNAVSRVLDDPLVTELAFVDQQGTYEEVAPLLLDSPQLLEGIEPEVLLTSFRVNVVDHDLSGVQALVRALRASPGVRDVVLDPEIPYVVIPDGLGPVTEAECPEMHLPADDNGDGIADSCMRVWDGGG